jgi:hypothetical protein
VGKVTSPEEGKRTHPVLAQPFGAVLRLVLCLIVEVPLAFFWRQRLGWNHRPQPTLPQDEEVPCWAKAAPDRRASPVAKPINEAALNIGFPIRAWVLNPLKEPRPLIQ